MPSAQLFRMKTDEHICPFGLKAKDLLERKGFTVDDQLLTDREQTDAFKEKHGVKTTPQVFIEGTRVGGYSDLRDYLGMPSKDKNKVTYVPIIAIFAMTALMAIAMTLSGSGEFFAFSTLIYFFAFSMCVLAIQKLRDLDAFSNQFLAYDLLAQRVVRYSYVYPFAEAFAGIGMLVPALHTPAGLAALFIGSIGAISVVKAVYVDKRELKCACVGGNSNVPLGFVSLTENLMMIAMGIWAMVKLF